MVSDWEVKPHSHIFQALCNSVINWKAAAEKVEKSGVKKPVEERGERKRKSLWSRSLGSAGYSSNTPFISLYVCSPLTCWAAESAFCSLWDFAG